MKYLRSTYRDSKKEQFELDILGEDENNYIVRIKPQWQKEYQEGDSISKLRKCLCDGSLYEVIESKEEPKQLSIFDLLC